MTYDYFGLGRRRIKREDIYDQTLHVELFARMANVRLIYGYIPLVLESVHEEKEASRDIYYY